MTLATLASHDNPAALDALSQHLNDDHAYVRGWVVNALGRVTPAIVEPRLKALSDSLRYADTRSQVASVLKRLSQGTSVQ
jgi:HEAT repeat protein